MLRQRRKLSQSALAKAARMSRPALVRIENGRQADLNLEALVRVADVLGCSVDMLLRGDVLDEPEKGEDTESEALAAAI